MGRGLRRRVYRSLSRSINTLFRRYRDECWVGYVKQRKVKRVNGKISAYMELYRILLPIFAHFWTLLPIFWKMRIFPKDRALSLFKISSCKTSEKTNEPIPRKMCY